MSEPAATGWEGRSAAYGLSLVAAARERPRAAAAPADAETPARADGPVPLRRHCQECADGRHGERCERTVYCSPWWPCVPCECACREPARRRERPLVTCDDPRHPAFNRERGATRPEFRALRFPALRFPARLAIDDDETPRHERAGYDRWRRKHEDGKKTLALYGRDHYRKMAALSAQVRAPKAPETAGGGGEDA